MDNRATRNGCCAAVAAGLVGTAGAQQLTSVAIATGLANPLFVTQPPADSSRLFIVEQRGSGGVATQAFIRILDVATNTVNPTPFLVVTGLSTAEEEGLLGLAFDPGYTNNGFFYICYTDSAGTVVVARYHVSADPNIADPASATIVLAVSHPTSNHNGGNIVFGRDGYLYVGLGDGGSGNDANGQSTNTLLGKLLRIAVSTLPYQIPATNPFVGNPNARPEIWAYGLRNPWRFSFDRLTGDLWIGDVGQNTWEELDYQLPQTPPIVAQNYGWHCYEGNAAFNTTGCADPSTMHFPVYVYPHSGTGCSGAIIGGYVYRGCAMPWLRGEYFFADFCFGRVSSFRYAGSGTVASVTDRTAELQPITGPQIGTVASFGQDNSGELYVCAGSVFKIVPRCTANCDGSTSTPVLNIGDFVCFLNQFASNDCYANCDGSTTIPILNVHDFACFINRFAAGCS